MELYSADRAFLEVSQGLDDLKNKILGLTYAQKQAAKDQLGQLKYEFKLASEIVDKISGAANITEIQRSDLKNALKSLKYTVERVEQNLV